MNTSRSKGGIIASVFVYLLELALLAVTGWHTFSVIELTLPGDNQIVGYAALGAFDAGLIIWSVVLMYAAKGKRQRATALTMVTVSLIGIAVAFFGDMFVQTAKRGLTSKLDEFTVTIIVVILGAVIIANIIAAVVFHINDPEHLKKNADEEAREEIYSQATELIKQQAKTLAAQLAPHVAQDWMTQMIQQQMSGLNITAQVPKAAPPTFGVLPQQLPVTNVDQAQQLPPPVVQPQPIPIQTPKIVPAQQPTFSADGGSSSDEDDGQLPNFLQRGQGNN